MDETLRVKLIDAGVDIDAALVRFMGRDDLLLRFLKKFVEDESYETLVGGLQNNSIKEAYKAAHTLKGLCANLSLTNLNRLAGAQAEFLKNENMEAAREIMGDITCEYEKIVDVLNNL